MENLNYGIIGNCRSAALISETGSIDWCCLPAFNSPSSFAKILDENKGGSFEIIIDDSYHIEQSYIRATNILKTRFSNNQDIFELIDYMPRYRNDDGKMYAPPDIVRYFKRIQGAPKFKLKYDPKIGYAAYPTKTVKHESYIKSYTTKGKYDSLYLYSDMDFDTILSGKEIYLTTDRYVLLSYNQKILRQSAYRSYLKMQRTKVYWLNWADRTRSFMSYNAEIVRSALTLKLLSYEKTGAVIAALTTSLPETIGEVRNWDYRFTWIRDAAMTIRVLIKLGHQKAAKRFLNFILTVVPAKDDKIQIMYGINGEKKLTEKILTHLDGYKGSKPVRVGNEAYKQKQHDIYGVLMDVIYQHFNLYTTTLENSEEFWTIIRSIVRSVASHWKKPDRGIWEIRNEQKHFTFSKVLCWVAIDRAVKIAIILRRTEYIKRWSNLRDKIYDDIIKNAWNEKIGSFTQAYGSEDLDASTLLLETYGFISALDPKFISTVKATKKYLLEEDLMFRYKNKDDFGVPSSSFTICTFWLINALYKIGEQDEAKRMFHQLLRYSNHLGLFSEDIDFKTKRLLGNFPQAYSHLALIETAITLTGGDVTSEEKILQAIRFD